MPELYIIIAQKYFLPNFGRHVPPCPPLPLPPLPTPMKRTEKLVRTAKEKNNKKKYH